MFCQDVFGERVSTSPSVILCTVDYRRGTYCYGIRCPPKKKKPCECTYATIQKQKKNNHHPQNATLKTANKSHLPQRLFVTYPDKKTHTSHHPRSQPAHPAHTRSRPYTAQLLQTGLRQEPQALSSAESSSTSIASSSFKAPSQSSQRGSCTTATRCVCGTIIGTGCSIRQKLCSVLFCGCGASCDCSPWYCCCCCCCCPGATPGSAAALSRCAWYRRWMVEAAIRHTSARARIWITAPSQGGGGEVPWTDSASGRLSRWRFRVRALRCEGVSGSKEDGFAGEWKGERMGLVCG